jgi:hypothetical protein
VRPRIVPSLARRIDRLALRAHRFHRFAHHPLCDEYAGELLQLRRRTRLCRGCTLFGAGLLAGLGAGLTMRPPPLFAVVVALVAAALAASSLFARSFKLVTRFLPGAGLAFAAGGGPWAVLASLGLGVVLAASYRRRGPDRSPCEACPERLRPEPCRGMAEIVRAERGFQRLSGRWLGRATFT